jgi:hypothetical protein
VELSVPFPIKAIKFISSSRLDNYFFRQPIFDQNLLDLLLWASASRAALLVKGKLTVAIPAGE